MTKNNTFLYILSGLPAVGKSTLSQRLAQHINAVYLRIDTVEQGLRDLCDCSVEGEGYRLSYRVARDNLILGNSVIADSCNPIELTRQEWQQVAKDSNAHFVDVEIICSDVREHQTRVETRRNTIKGLVLPNWQQVQSREYHARTHDVIVIDTAQQSEHESFKTLLQALAL